MFRSILFLAALTFVIGCKKGGDVAPSEKDNSDTVASKTDDAKTDNPNTITPKAGNPKKGTPKAKPGVPKSDEESIDANVPKLQPRVKFKLPAKLGDRFDYRPVLEMSADGRTLAVLLKTDQICVYDITGEPKLTGQYNGHRLALSPSGKVLFAGSNLSDCRVYDLATKKQIVKASFSTSFTDTCVYFHNDNTIVHTVRSQIPTNPSKGRITIWDYAKDTQSSFDIPDNRFNEAFTMSGSKELWLLTERSYRNKFEIECYDVAGKKLVRTIKAVSEAGVPYTEFTSDVSVAADGSAFAVVGYKAPIFDTASGKIVSRLPTTISAHKAGLLPPNGRFYLGRGGAKGISIAYEDHLLYDWKAQRVAAVLVSQSKDITEAIGTPDGRILIIVSQSGEALLYDLSGVK